MLRMTQNTDFKIYTMRVSICLLVHLSCAALNEFVSSYVEWGHTLKQVHLWAFSLSVSHSFSLTPARIETLSARERHCYFVFVWCDLHLSMCERLITSVLFELTPWWGIVLLTHYSRCSVPAAAVTRCLCLCTCIKTSTDTKISSCPSYIIRTMWTRLDWV